MGSSSFNLPTVERALTEMEGGLSTAAAPERKATRRVSRLSKTNYICLSLIVCPQETRTSGAHTLAGAGLAQARQAGAAVLSGSPSPSGQDQHEVLRKFFDGLLNSRGDRAATPATGRAPSTQSNQSGASGQNGTNVNADEHDTSESPVPPEPNGSGSGGE